jgi:hypothetical protein
MEPVPGHALSEKARSRLVKLCANPGAEPGVFFRSEEHRPRLIVASLIAGAIGLVSALLTVAELLNTRSSSSSKTMAIAAFILITLPAILYFFVVTVELIRSQGSRLRPFTLISPVEIIEGDYDYGVFCRYRLSDVTDFSTVHEYGFAQRYKGLRYKFAFPVGAFSVLLSDRHELATLDAVLSEARSLRDDEPAKTAAFAKYSIFSEPGTSQRMAQSQGPRLFSRPFSALWIGVGALYMVAFGLLVIFTSRRR